MKCGYISIVGRPNVGKSTLLNRLIGQKISITSRKPQTTRHNILGIKTTGEAQFIYIDTPGMHENNVNAMNQYMNRMANQSLHDVDVILFVIEGLRFTSEDETVLKKLGQSTTPLFLVVNKLDKIENKADLLPFMEKLAQQITFAEVIPVSAKSGTQIEELEKSIKRYLPESDAIFPEDQVTDRSMRFITAEIIREKLIRNLGQELPYAVTVEIEQFKDQAGLTEIAAAIWVERKGQKAIIIGKKGETLKKIGQQARQDLEKMIEQKVFLQLWVKVKEGWSSDIRALKSLGYHDD